MSTTFITGQTLGTLRSNFTGTVGLKFTPVSELVIKELGRWVVAGNSKTHVITIYSGSVLASVTVDCNGATAAQYLYGTLTPPFIATAGTGYFLESSEVNGQDQWYGSDTVVTPTTDAADNGSASTHALDGGGVNHSHGPVNFKYDAIGSNYDWSTGQGWYGKLSTALSGWSGFNAISIRNIVADGRYMVIGGKDTSEGDPAQPSLRLDAKGMWRFRWAVASGSRSVSINVKQAVNGSPRPTLVVKANPSIGVNSDVTGTAGSGTGWVTIGPVSITPSSDGAVWVELHNNYDSQVLQTPCFWDHIVTA